MYTQNLDGVEEALRNVPKGFSFEVNHLETEKGNIVKTHSHKLISGHGRSENFIVFPGVVLTHLLFAADYMNKCNHNNSDHVLEINYCRYGRVGWDMIDGQSIFLGPDDFSVNTQALCADSVMSLPSGFYEGITITINTKEFDENLPEILADTGVSAESLREKLCPGNIFSLMTGSEITRPIFAGFFTENEPLKKASYKIKFLELLLYLTEMKKDSSQKIGQYNSEQTEIVKQIHDYLLSHLDEKITIETVSDMFHINPTTVKQVFKGVYGDSIASHIREHRMELAARLLEETDQSVAEIAGNVGYGSQSKFAQNFKENYGMLPLEYRKKHRL